MELITARLRLRQWRDEDLEGYAALNADPRVREFFVTTLTREESAALMQLMREHWTQHRFGMWAVEVLGGASFIGFIGLGIPPLDAHFMPSVEIGWRLAFEHWGNGYATEGARAALGFAFNTLKLPEVVAITAVANVRSRRVMEKIGMRHNPADDFDHPNVPEGHSLRRHVLYRITADAR